MNTRIFNSLKNNTIVQIVAGIVVVVCTILLVGAGASFLGVLLLVVLIGLSIYFGSISEISSSALLAVLLKIAGGTALQLVSIFSTAPEYEKVYNLVNSTGYVQLILTFFLFAHFISFTTSRIKIFHFTSNVTNNFPNKKRDENLLEKKEDETDE